MLILREGDMSITEKVHHVSLYEPLNPMIKTLKTKPIRTFLKLYEDFSKDDSIVNPFIPSFKCLRVLSLASFGLKEVPKCLGKLSHLRYLNLSFNNFKVLPNSIIKLKNLQTLKVKGCLNWIRFPEFTRELMNFRHLENDWCVKLTQMPYGIGELTLLQSLPLFIVGTGKAGDHKIGGLSELKRLNQLRGELRIRNLENVRDVVPVSRGEILKGKPYLRSLRLEWERWDENGELVMEGLQPHPNLKDLFIQGYGDRRFPSWMLNDRLGSLLPNLIKIQIWGCSRCQILPPFSHLPSLRSLDLCNMEEVEEMEEGPSAALFFPSLQSLKINWMPELKGLWRMESKAKQCPSFRHLSELYISRCSNLTSIQLSSSPSLFELEVNECSNLTSFELPSSPCLSQLVIQDCLNLTSVELHSSPCLSQLEISRCPCPCLTSLKVVSLPCLEHLSLSRVREEVLRQIMFVSAFSSSLKSLSLGNIDDTTCISLSEQLLQHVSTLQTLNMWDCPELMTSLPREMPSLKTLQMLEIRDCSGLATLPHWIGSLTSLAELHICKCRELTSLPEEIHSLKTLQILKIYCCTALAALPHSIGSLTSLEVLDLTCCHQLASLPEEMRSLKNLQMLYISHCPHLEERCRKETGEDWPISQTLL